MTSKQNCTHNELILGKQLQNERTGPVGGMTHPALEVYKGPGRVEHTSEIPSHTLTETSPPDAMCGNYYGNAPGGCDYGCGYDSLYGSGYGCGGYSSGCG